jgi:hypothetical protein
MSRSTLTLKYLLVAAFLTAATTAHAITLTVNCGQKEGLSSIGAALTVLQGPLLAAGPNTIKVSGSCHENLFITGMDLLTIAGTNGASLTDASAGALDVVNIRGSRVTITGMNIDGQSGQVNDTIDCGLGSQCTLIGNTLNGGADVVGVYNLSTALIVGGVIQNGTSDGIFTNSDVAAYGVKIQGNPVGAVVRTGGRLRLSVADPATFPQLFQSPTPTTVSNNSGDGIDVSSGEFSCTGCVVENNSGDGIHADVSAAVTLGQANLQNGTSVHLAVTLNAGHGVYLGDLSSGIFNGPGGNVTGNAQPNVLCNTATSVSRRALIATGGAANTNCTN